MLIDWYVDKIIFNYICSNIKQIINHSNKHCIKNISESLTICATNKYFNQMCENYFSDLIKIKYDRFIDLDPTRHDQSSILYYRQLNNSFIFEIYKHYLDIYTKKYGNKTIILMQQGSFYEFYGVDNQYEKIGQAYEIAKMLNIYISVTKKKQLNNRKYHLLAGFPKSSLNKYINILLGYNYVIVIVDQISPLPYPKRKVTTIYDKNLIIKI